MTASPSSLSPSSFGLDGRVVLITGAGSGIGQAAAVAFAEAGAHVALAGRRLEHLEETRKLLPDPDDALVLRCDVDRESDVVALVDAVAERFGRLNVAFNNAGTFGRFGPLHEDDEENFDLVVGTNLRGLWRCMRHQVARMLQNGGGSIVNCASVAAHLGHARSPLYSATKHAVVGLSKSAALQYAGSGIRVNVVSPGSTDTDMLRSLYEDAGALQARSSRAPLKRLGTPAEVANAAVWLASPLSGYVTGQTLPVDGGVTAGSSA
ncbi:short-chain dehydrogenase [Streptacidiphilus pinicola]|uniref:Short-chain dehydrogenase n=1 Tax=Streptacidiphilus pinicola TaxID=2219663 RepID=A0A2X0IEP9_9ACTN|nr:glucose 1-dehydrogenase [Streptacidiphilus pinicola]RAG81911.1 short-chain dehydrogenase [Streptacidiphilus pinicola]